MEGDRLPDVRGGQGVPIANSRIPVNNGVVSYFPNAIKVVRSSDRLGLLKCDVGVPRAMSWIPILRGLCCVVIWGGALLVAEAKDLPQSEPCNNKLGGSLTDCCLSVHKSEGQILTYGNFCGPNYGNGKIFPKSNDKWCSDGVNYSKYKAAERLDDLDYACWKHDCSYNHFFLDYVRSSTDDIESRARSNRQLIESTGGLSDWPNASYLVQKRLRHDTARCRAEAGRIANSFRDKVLFYFEHQLANDQRELDRRMEMRLQVGKKAEELGISIDDVLLERWMRESASSGTNWLKIFSARLRKRAKAEQSRREAAEKDALETHARQAAEVPNELGPPRTFRSVIGRSASESSTAPSGSESAGGQGRGVSYSCVPPMSKSCTTNGIRICLHPSQDCP